jgi:hypothetical protein
MVLVADAGAFPSAAAGMRSAVAGARRDPRYQQSHEPLEYRESAIR